MSDETNTNLRISPPTNTELAFVKRFDHNLYLREQQVKEEAFKRQESVKFSRLNMKSAKPSLEIYRPPSLRVSGDFSAYSAVKAGLPQSPTAIYPQPVAVSIVPIQTNGTLTFVPATATNVAVSYHQAPPHAYHPHLYGGPYQPAPLYINQAPNPYHPQPSPSMTITPMVVPSQPTQPQHYQFSAQAISKSASTPHAHKVHFQIQPPTAASQFRSCSPPPLKTGGSPTNSPSSPTAGNKPKPSGGLKRSKSLGAADLAKVSLHPQFDLSSFGLDIQTAVRRALDDPNKLPVRQLMEIVRHLFNRVLEGTRFAEPTARMCSMIIEKEKNETFVDNLINTCREWYNERERNILRNSTHGAPSSLGGTTSRWVSYVTFLLELYTRLKSQPRNSAASSVKNAPPAAVLLTLLAECCRVFLRPPYMLSLMETECLFFVLTSIGRDLQTELPQMLNVLMAAVRDAFVTKSVPDNVRKTLLQLIELHASGWQLKAHAVMYYYPGSHDRK